MKKVGLFGGTFDPVHTGHIQLAAAAKQAMSLDEIWLLIEKKPRGKQPIANYKRRLAMAKLAFRKLPYVLVDRLDVQREGATHDHTTMLNLVELFPKAAFTLIMGTDVIIRFPYWEAPEVFCENAHFALMRREPYMDFDDVGLKNRLGPAGNNFRYTLINIEPIANSSGDIRRQLLAGERPGGLDSTVAEYITAHKLYKGL